MYDMIFKKQSPMLAIVNVAIGYILIHNAIYD